MAGLLEERAAARADKDWAACRRDPRPDRRGRHRGRGHPRRPEVDGCAEGTTDAGQQPAQGRDPEDSKQAHRRVGRAGPPRARGQGADAQGGRPPQPQGPQVQGQGRSGRRRVAPSAARGRATTSGSAGRNSVVEALRAGVPVTGAVRRRGRRARRPAAEAFKIAADRGISLLEVTTGRARPAYRRGGAPGPRGADPGVRVRPPDRPARRGRPSGRGAADRGPRLRDRPAQPRCGGALGRRRSAPTVSWSPSGGRPG